MKKKIGVIMLLLLAVFSLCGFSRDDQKIFDGAGLFSEEEKAELQEAAADAAEALELDVIVMTTDDVEGKDPDRYAEDFFVEHQFGYEKENGSGILFMIDMDTRYYSVITAGYAIERFTDDEIESIYDQLEGEMRDGDYAGAAGRYIRLAEKYGNNNRVAENGYYDPDTDKFIETDGTPASKWARAFSPEAVIIRILLSALLSAVFVFIMYRTGRSRMTVSCRTYLHNNQLKIRKKEDRFVNTTVVTRHIPKNEGSSGGGGGGHSSSHTGGGGRSFGGGGGRSF